MSGIAGIVSFDGGQVQPGLLARMTNAMVHRGPDSIEHWERINVALGHCMLRTTPESLDEFQPLTNEDASVVLVMDGRVDNGDDLRRDLQHRGAILRNRTDAELVLRAYEVWGENCPDRIIGEFVFLVWDNRRHRLFGARDAAGARHFYYHVGQGWFSFASEIKGLLAAQLVESRLNESRLLDYLVPDFDRDDQVGTFYQGIVRLPAGHAIEVSARRCRTWRYWEPADLPTLKFGSVDECAEAFLDQLRVAVKCRLRSIGPVGALLSGGLDSSSIVGLVRKDFRDELSSPLKTISLIREDSENCKDWEYVQEVIKGGWIEPVVISTAVEESACKSYMEGIAQLDEPFALSNGLIASLVYGAASRAGCRVLLDGMAGDTLFYSLSRSLDVILRKQMLSHMLALISAFERHQTSYRALVLKRALVSVVPEGMRAHYRARRQRLMINRSDISRLRRDKAIPWLDKKLQELQLSVPNLNLVSDQTLHARSYTSGLISFPHELGGEIAFSKGVEPRSPFSDRRLIEFGIGLPAEYKFAAPWYKYLMRKATATILPDSVRWRSDLGNHPGWKAFDNLINATRKTLPEIWDLHYLKAQLEPWLNCERLERDWENYRRNPCFENGLHLFILSILARWLASGGAFSDVLRRPN